MTGVIATDPPVSEAQRRAATEMEKAYLAGIVDGEGCIGAARYKRQGARGRNAMFTVFVSMTDREPVDLIASLYGGHVRERRDRRTDHRRLVMYTWQGYGNIGAKFITDVLPYLRVKRGQAFAYLEAMTTFTGGPRKGFFGSVAPSPEDLAKRFACLDTIQRLNQRVDHACS